MQDRHCLFALRKFKHIRIELVLTGKVLCFKSHGKEIMAIWGHTLKFAQLLFGVDVAFENYAERLPHRSNKSFLLFAKGACAEGRPFFEIGDFIAPQLEEIQRWEENVRNNNARPTKSQQILNADGWTGYYWSAQVTHAPCLCRSIFGADTHQKHVPTSSAMWKGGSRFEKLWDATLMKKRRSRISA